MITDELKQAAVEGFVKLNPHQDGIDYDTMMEILLDSDAHLPIVGDVDPETAELGLAQHLATVNGWHP